MSTSPRRRDQDVLLREVAGEVFLVPIRGKLADLQDLFALNRTGTWLWQRLDGSRSIDQLVSEMASEFGIGVDEARGDVIAFMNELTELELLASSAEDTGR